MQLSRILASLAAVAVFAQTGVTQLPFDDATKSLLVFGIGMISVFLASITHAPPPEPPTAA